MRIKLSFATVLILFSASVFAQVSQVRFEIPLSNSRSEGYATVSLNDGGLLLYALAFGKDKNAIELIRLDTAFKEVWKGFIPVERNIYIAASRPFDGKVHFLLKDRFNPLAEFIFLSIAEKDGNYTVRSVKTLLAMSPTHFIVTKEAALIGGYFNNRPLVLYFGFSNNQSRILPGFFNEPGELNQIKTDDDGSITIVVSGKSPNRKRTLWVRNYDNHGTLIKTTWLDPGDDKVFTFGRTVSQKGGSQIVCGVYGRFTEYSRGIFIANVDPEGNYTVKYYNYADLEHFFNYMKAKREKRVKERIQRRKVKGKKIKFNYRLLVDELIPYGDEVVMLGEAFYPHYSYPNSNSMFGARSIYSTMIRPGIGPTSTAYTRGDLVFDGYQYTHAVVIGFDKEGNLKWDNSFEINDVRTMNLEQFVKIHPEKQRISLVYLFDNIIRSKIIKDSEILEGKSYSQIETGMPDDLVRERDTRDTKLEYWYGDTFYASGVQNIRKRRDDGLTISRRVFFINKIAYK